METTDAEEPPLPAAVSAQKLRRSGSARRRPRTAEGREGEGEPVRPPCMGEEAQLALVTAAKPAMQSTVLAAEETSQGNNTKINPQTPEKAHFLHLLFSVEMALALVVAGGDKLLLGEIPCPGVPFPLQGNRKEVTRMRTPSKSL